MQFNINKTGLQPVTKPVERVHSLGGGVGVQSSFDAIAVQTVTFLAMHVCIYQTSGAVTVHFLPYFNQT